MPYVIHSYLVCFSFSSSSLTLLALALVQVNEVKNVMVENIERVLERGEKIELLVDRTDDLRNQVCVCVCVGGHK